jgi:hypothetical protein
MGVASMGKKEGKRQLSRHRYRWHDNIEEDLTEIGWLVMYWIHLV